jgi:hypothetical protein
MVSQLTRTVNTAIEAFTGVEDTPQRMTISPILLAQTSDDADRSVVRRMSARNGFSPNDLVIEPLTP